jgi:hypothetical protein
MIVLVWLYDCGTCDCVTMWLLLCDCVTMWVYDYVTVWLCDCVTVWLCDYVTVRLRDCVTMSLCDCDYVLMWSLNMWLCDCVTMWLCDYVTVWLCDLWLCDCVTMWLFDWLYDYVTVTTWLCCPVAQHASSTHIGLTKLGLCTPATCSLMTNTKNVSETSALTHYWSVQAPGKIPTQLPLSLTCLTTLQYVYWRHVSAIERVLRWPPASFKRPHPGPIAPFYTWPVVTCCTQMSFTRNLNVML